MELAEVPGKEPAKGVGPHVDGTAHSGQPR